MENIDFKRLYNDFNDINTGCTDDEFIEKMHYIQATLQLLEVIGNIHENLSYWR